ncbi:hypothetical protein BDV59DRAFT_171361 [Aspergillus ambiguus]|uniref:FAD-dependent oxidoreductase n=1 Tax=Aspergillus ambiguus TaxID=176160 RepID=UPI003CCDCBAE
MQSTALRLLPRRQLSTPTYIPSQTPRFARVRRQMSSPSSKKPSIPHVVRTAAEPRQNRLYNVRLSHIEQANPTVRLLQLTLPPQASTPEESQEDAESDQPEPFTFLPGQWLDVHIPTVSTAGGFSITSTPADAQALPSLEPTTESLAVDDEETGLPPLDPRGRAPYVELAVQYAPSNPASAWLWRPKHEILGKDLTIRVGGSLVWPPAGIDLGGIRNVVFVAGGMGINPLISMLSHLNNHPDGCPSLRRPCNIHFLYSSKLPREGSSESPMEQVPFLSRLRQIMRSHSTSQRLQISLDLFLTGLSPESPVLREPPLDITVHPRRISHNDLQLALAGPEGTFRPEETLCYMCGPPKMTDEFIPIIQNSLGQKKEHVFWEKWW